MIQGHLNLSELAPQHQDQHRRLFMGAQGVIEKVATIAPTTNSLPVGYIQFALIGGAYYLYANINDVLVRWTGTIV